MKKSVAILLTILMLFSFFQGALRENVVRAVIQPIWSMFHYNEQHTGQCPYNTSSNGGTLKWRYLTGDDVRSSPAIASDGTIYVGSDDHYLYAINPNGTLKWEHQTDGDILSSPAIAGDGTVYVGSYKYLYAIYPGDGTLKWSYEAGYEFNYSSPAIAPDGTIYVGSYDNYLYAINPNGTLKWKRLTGNVIYSSPAIAGDGTVYVGSNSSYLYAINPDDGTLKWAYETDYPIYYSSPAISSDGTIYVGSYDNYLYAIGGTSSSDLNMHITSPTAGATISTNTFPVSGTFDVLPTASNFQLIVAVGVESHIYNFTVSGLTWGPVTVNMADFPGMVAGGYYFATLQASAVGITIPSYQTGPVVINWNPSNVSIFSLHIPSGWSLISVPFDTDASLLSCPLIYYFNGSTWQPETATLHPGRGYLVLSTTPTSRDVILTGTPHSSPFPFSSPGSWQLIGNPFASPCTLSSTSPILLIYFFNSTTSTWQPADTNNLQPGMGYLVLTSSSGTFTFTINP